MKKLTWMTIAILAGTAILSFTDKPSSPDKIKITVTAAVPTHFDMYRDFTTKRGLLTPYEFTMDAEDSKFIFKSESLKTPLKITVQRSDKSELKAEWPITVLLIYGSEMSTFGID
jgi:hypothetical protein